jgi:hypothetical protein
VAAPTRAPRSPRRRSGPRDRRRSPWTGRKWGGSP